MHGLSTHRNPSESCQAGKFYKNVRKLKTVSDSERIEDGGKLVVSPAADLLNGLG